MMMPLSLLRMSLVFIITSLSAFVLQAGEDRDSTAVLSCPAFKEVVSIYAPLIDGGHPSQFQFAISNPSEKQYKAWLRGDFIPLQGLFTIDSTDTRNSKAAMFGNINSAVDSARAVIAKVQEIGNFISQFDGQSLVKLPVGMEKIKEDGTRFVIAINRITLYPTHAELTVYANAQTADMEAPLILGAPDIKFTRRGGISLGSLGLIGAVSAPILDSMAFFTFAGAQIVNNDFVQGMGTYVTFDCDGLQEFNLDAKIIFSRKVMIPVDIDSSDLTQDSTFTQPSTPEDVVVADLDIMTQDGLNNILVDINIDRPFAHPSKKDVVWTVRDVVFDFSEASHSPSVQFPVAGYTPDLPPETIQLWKGIHIGEVSVKLPDDFIGTDSSTLNINNITIQNVVIDHTGFTGIVKLQPVLDLNQGNMDGWGFSIDSLQLHIYQNNLAAFAFDGLINIPLFSEEDDGNNVQEVNSIRYGAYFDIYDDVYNFTISETEDRVLHSKMLQSTVTLFPTSHLDVTYSKENGFDVSATLHGVLDVDVSLGGSDTTGIQIPSIEFQDFTIANRGQFIRNAGSWNIESVEVSLKAFKLTINNVSMVGYPDDPQRVDVQFMAMVNIGSKDTTSVMSLSAVGGFRLKGRIDILDDGKQNWRYDGFKMDLLHVDLNTPSVEFKGEIIFFEDIPGFGTGFQGKVSLVLKKMNGGTGIEAMALFGSVDNYRYFFVDVMTKIPAGVLTVGGIDIRGLGGGLYVHMRQVSISQNFEAAATDDILPDYDPAAENNAAGSITAYEQAILDRLGVSLSGIEYEPDPSIKFGINLGVVIATTKEEAFNANVILNFEFNQAGGLNRIRLAGYANAMAPISWNGPACTGISIRFEMNYVSGNNTETGNGEFSAQAQVFVNMQHVRGSSVITSNESNHNAELPDFYVGVDCDALYYAGGIDIFLSKNDWWINIGIPNPNKESGYPFPHFPIGLELDNLGPIGGEITAYLDIGTNLPPFPGLPDNVAELAGLDNLIADEQDRATGNGFAFGARLIIDSRIGKKGIVEARLELDLGFDIMLQKYENAICVNNGNRPLGFNSWYAAGQAWVYVSGGISVLGFSVMEATIAAVIQVKGPNPLYGRGAIAGRYSVLGGLKKGDFRFPLEFGKECELEGGGSISLDYAIIDGILPIDMAKNVTVDAKPVISFAYPIDEVVSLSNPAEGEPEHFIIRLTEFDLQLDGQSIEGELLFDEDGYAAEFIPLEMLQGESDYVILTTAKLYESTAYGSIISDELDADIKTINFTTGEAIDYIPLGNIVNAWPADGQFNYYQDEAVPNMLTLASGQDELLTTPEGFTPIIRLSNEEEVFEIPFSYDADANQINYDLPVLTSGGAYKTEVLFSSENDAEDQLILKYYFRVSRYATFAEKMGSVNSASLTKGLSYKSVFENLLEPFGIEEVIGVNWLAEPTLSIVANLENTPWMQQFFSISAPGGNFNMYGLNSECEGNNVRDLNYIYNGVPRQLYGVLPTKAVFVEQDNVNLFHIKNENYQFFHSMRDANLAGLNNSEAKIQYLIPGIVAGDYNMLKALIEDFSYLDVLQEDIDTYCPMGEINTLWDEIEESFNANPCRKYYYSLSTFNSSQNPCDFVPTTAGETFDISVLIEDRDINLSIDQGSHYPVYLKYTFPNGYESGTNRNLQYSGS